MKKLVLFTLIGLFLNVNNVHAQNYTLAVNKLDEFTKEIVRIAPYQSISAYVLVRSTFVNINIRRKGNNYFIGWHSQFYSASKSMENSVVKKGTKLYLKLQNDSIAVATYNSDDLEPIVTYDSTFGNWQYNFTFDYSIDSNELEKLLQSPMILARVENNKNIVDFEIREKFRGTSPQLYFMNFIPLLK
jgi:hypothetical protein